MNERAWKELNNQEKNDRLDAIERLWRVHGLDPKSIAESLFISRAEVRSLIAAFIMTDEEAEKLLK